MSECHSRPQQLLAALAFMLAALSAAAAPLRPFEVDSLRQILAARAGRSVVVAFWATDCPPCRAELAHWGEWKQRHPDVDVLLVNVDPPELQAEAAQALAAVRLAGVETWGFADAYAERLRWSVDPAWRGEVPRTHLYDAEHRLTVRAGRCEPRDLERWAAAIATPGQRADRQR